MSQRSRDHELRELLRAGDPLSPGEELQKADANHMRRTVLAASPRFARRRQWRMALAAATLAAVTAGAYLLSPGSWDLRRDPGLVPAGGGSVAVADPRDRQIQFTTRGGTRVIWVLRPSTP